MTEKQKKALTIAGFIIFLAVMGLVTWFVGRPLISFAKEPEKFREWVNGFGVWGKLIFVGLIVLQIIVAFIPGEPFEIVAGYAFGTFWGTLLCVVGDVDADEVCAIAERSTQEERQALPMRDYGAAETMLPMRTRTQRRMEVSMPTFSLGFKCAPPKTGMETMRREIIGDLAAEILVGESSPLYQRLYETGLIDADFSAGYESVKNACIFSAGGDSKDPEAVLAALLEEAQRIEREGFDAALFERLKKSAFGRRTRDLDSFESICYRICAYNFDGADYFRFPEAYASVTAEDVKNFLRETVRPERAAMSIVRPKEQEDVI